MFVCPASSAENGNGTSEMKGKTEKGVKINPLESRTRSVLIDTKTDTQLRVRRVEKKWKEGGEKWMDQKKNEKLRKTIREMRRKKIAQEET